MTQDVANENNDPQDKYLFHKKAIVIAISVLVIFLVLLDTYYDQQKPREMRPLVPITFTPPPEMPDDLLNQEQDEAGQTQGSIDNEQ